MFATGEGLDIYFEVILYIEINVYVRRLFRMLTVKLQFKRRIMRGVKQKHADAESWRR
jgi:hypothetical protein